MCHKTQTIVSYSKHSVHWYLCIRTLWKDQSTQVWSYVNPVTKVNHTCGGETNNWYARNPTGHRAQLHFKERVHITASLKACLEWNLMQFSPLH